jgi:Ras-related protein Rab-5C
MKPNEGLPQYKAIVVGDTAVGKTSIILRFHHNVFLPDHQPTVGGSFITKRVETPHGPASLNLWDTAGQERYRSLVPIYCRGASVALIVFDVSDAHSFNELGGWLQRVRETAADQCVILVVANKLDLDAAVTSDKITEWTMKQNVKCFFVSALDGNGIQELFTEVCGSLGRHVHAPVIDPIAKVQKGKEGCCGA